MKKRPISVTIIGCLFAAVGVVSLAFHLYESKAQLLQWDVMLVCSIAVIAIICGVYMLRGSNWARWLALAWMAFHVIISVFHPWHELAIHAVLFAVLVYLLLRAPAAKYFRPARTEMTS